MQPQNPRKAQKLWPISRDHKIQVMLNHQRGKGKFLFIRDLTKLRNICCSSPLCHDAELRDFNTGVTRDEIVLGREKCVEQMCLIEVIDMLLLYLVRWAVTSMTGNNLQSLDYKANLPVHKDKNCTIEGMLMFSTVNNP